MRLIHPVAFDAPDGKPVSVMFVLLVPEQATELHLQILSELAQLLSDADMREQINLESDATVLHQKLITWSENAADQRRAAV